MKASERPIAKIIDICSNIPGALDSLTYRQRDVLDRLSVCRTQYLGTMAYQCENEECGHVEHRFISCKNRSCSVCSWLPREKWKMQRENDIIPNTQYYHNVFTIPHDMSLVASQNQREVQTLLFKCVDETLKSFAETHCKCGMIGFMLVLHTWSTRLLEHYHIHATIPGGFLLNGIWNEMPTYLFPAKALAQVFRAKFCSGLRKLHRQGKLRFQGYLAELNDPAIFGRMVEACFRKKWHVHSEVSKGRDPEKLIGYLANYVYKTAIDHSRIESVDDSAVEFSYRHREENGTEKWKKMALAPQEFLRRFAGHVQPRMFARIRYYGFLGGGVKNKYLAIIFKQKESEYEGKNQKIHRSSCENIIAESKRMEPTKCPVCAGMLLSPWEQMRRRSAKDPPINNDANSNQYIQQKSCA